MYPSTQIDSVNCDKDIYLFTSIQYIIKNYLSRLVNGQTVAESRDKICHVSVVDDSVILLLAYIYFFLLVRLDRFADFVRCSLSLRVDIVFAIKIFYHYHSKFVSDPLLMICTASVSFVSVMCLRCVNSITTLNLFKLEFPKLANAFIQARVSREKCSDEHNLKI